MSCIKSCVNNFFNIRNICTKEINNKFLNFKSDGVGSIDCQDYDFQIWCAGNIKISVKDISMIKYKVL